MQYWVTIGGARNDWAPTRGGTGVGGIRNPAGAGKSFIEPADDMGGVGAGARKLPLMLPAGIKKPSPVGLGPGGTWRSTVLSMKRGGE